MVFTVKGNGSLFIGEGEKGELPPASKSVFIGEGGKPVPDAKGKIGAAKAKTIISKFTGNGKPIKVNPSVAKPDDTSPATGLPRNEAEMREMIDAFASGESSHFQGMASQIDEAALGRLLQGMSAGHREQFSKLQAFEDLADGKGNDSLVPNTPEVKPEATLKVKPAYNLSVPAPPAPKMHDNTDS